MRAMIDPSDALPSFQAALNSEEIRPQRAALDPTVFVYQDQNGRRLTYARLEGKTVKAIVVLANVEPIEGTPCFQIGYAVPEQFRRKGLAKVLVEAAIVELKAGLARNGVPKLCIEAVVAADNEASKRVAEQVLSKNTTPKTDKFSGVAALQYVRHVG